MMWSMTKRLTVRLDYDASVDAVTTMLFDPAFRDAVCDRQHVTRRTISIQAVGDGFHVSMDKWQPTQGVPSFAQKFVGEETNIIQKEIWTTPTLGDITIEIPGKPGVISGTAKVDDDGNGRAVETVTLDIEVGIPLIGGKVEGLLHDLIEKAMQREHEVGRDYLSR